VEFRQILVAKREMPREHYVETHANRPHIDRLLAWLGRGVRGEENILSDPAHIGKK
jgi:hypothetical protein